MPVAPSRRVRAPFLVCLPALLLAPLARADPRSPRLQDLGLRPPVASPLVDGEIATLSDRPWRDQGSATRLEGLVCVEHVFVRDPQWSFSESQRASALQSSRAGLHYLQSEADKRGVPLRFRETVSDYASGEAISSSSIEHAWTEQALLAQTSQQELYAPITRCDEEVCEQRLAILHVPLVGRSYALPSLFNADSQVERAVMFMRELTLSATWANQSDGPRAQVRTPERPASFVHELLHLFGAEDLYQPEERLRAAQQRFPNEVMLQSNRSLEYVEIGDFTAYAVGWSDREPPALR